MDVWVRVHADRVHLAVLRRLVPEADRVRFGPRFALCRDRARQTRQDHHPFLSPPPVGVKRYR